MELDLTAKADFGSLYDQDERKNGPFFQQVQLALRDEVDPCTSRTSVPAVQDLVPAL